MPLFVCVMVQVCAWLFVDLFDRLLACLRVRVFTNVSILAREDVFVRWFSCVFA